MRVNADNLVNENLWTMELYVMMITNCFTPYWVPLGTNGTGRMTESATGFIKYHFTQNCACGLTQLPTVTIWIIFMCCSTMHYWIKSKIFFWKIKVHWQCLTIQFSIFYQVVTCFLSSLKLNNAEPRLVLEWLAGAQVMLPTMCRGAGQAFRIMLPLSTQQW